MYVAAAADMMYDVRNDDADDDDDDDDDDAMKMYVAAAADMMYDVPNDDADDDDDAMKNQFSVECSQRPFASVYYLQLDSRTK